MPDVFISYRRTDSGYVRSLQQSLSKHFEADRFFRDIDNLEAGVDFPEALDRELKQCKAMLVVIGPAWASMTDKPGQGPRILKAEDFVRQEVAAGLARKEVRVIPVLVGGAVLPQAAELPPELKDLTRRNAFELSDSRWEFDAQKLANTLDTSVGRSWLTGKRAIGAAAAIVVCVAAVAAYRFDLIGLGRGGDPLVLAQQKEAAILKTSAEASKARAEQAEAEARTARADLEKKKIAEEQAKFDARLKAEQAEQGRLASLNASGADKAAAEAEAARLAKENDEAQRLAAAKAAEAEAARTRDAKAQADAKSLKASQEEEAAAAARSADVARVAAQSAAAPKGATGAAPGVLSFPGWALSSGGCGTGAITVTGTARFSIEKTAEGIVVSEEFRGSGGGFSVVVTGKGTFPKEQKSYDITTTGQWNGGKVFASAGTDRVNTSDGLTPRTANVIKFQTRCG